MDSLKIWGRLEALQNQASSSEVAGSMDPTFSIWVYGFALHSLGPLMLRIVFSDKDKLPLPTTALGLSSS